MSRTQYVRSVEHVDPETGLAYRQLTSTGIGFQHLYFTCSSFTRDGRLVLIGHADSGPNLFTLRLDDGCLTQLTDNRDGTQRSYIYFDEQPGRGFQRASPSYCPASNMILYITGAEVRLVDVDAAEERLLFRLPPGAVTAYTHLSPDGRFACVPIVPVGAFDYPPVRQPNPALAAAGWTATDPFIAIRDRFGPRGLQTEVLVIELDSGDTSRSFAVPGWVTHVQFSPTDSRRVLFNNEGATELPAQLGTVEQRMWLYDGLEQRRVRDERETPGVELFISHEVWLQAGHAVIYHGSFLDTLGHRRQFVGRASVDEPSYAEVEFPLELTAFSHFTPDRDGSRLITDGVIDTSSLSLCTVDWSSGAPQWTRLCRHNTSWANQDVHPHPIFGPGDRSILWSSDAHNVVGSPHVYLMDLPEGNAVTPKRA